MDYQNNPFDYREYSAVNPSCPYCYHSNKSSGGKNPLAIILPLICVLVVVALVGGAIFMNPEIVDFTKRVIDSNVSGETSNSNTSKQNNKQKQQNTIFGKRYDNENGSQLLVDVLAELLNRGKIKRKDLLTNEDFGKDTGCKVSDKADVPATKLVEEYDIYLGTKLDIN